MKGRAILERGRWGRPAPPRSRHLNSDPAEAKQQALQMCMGVCSTKGMGRCRGPEAGVSLVWRNGKETGVAGVVLMREDGSGGGWQPDVRPSTGVAQLFRQTHTCIVIPLMLSPPCLTLPKQGGGSTAETALRSRHPCNPHEAASWRCSGAKRTGNGSWGVSSC